jgi:hypothetical protein
MKLNLFSRRPRGILGVAQSQLYDQDSFYPDFVKSLLRAQSEVVIESPFITMKRLNALLPTLQKLSRKGTKIIINTRPPEEQDGFLRAEMLEAVPILQDLGAEVFYIGGHHRKLAIIDRRILWEGSLNILSQGDSCEIMRRINSEVLAMKMIKFMDINRKP